jgi:hypothetical protein
MGTEQLPVAEEKGGAEVGEGIGAAPAPAADNGEALAEADSAASAFP